MFDDICKTEVWCSNEASDLCVVVYCDLRLPLFPVFSFFWLHDRLPRLAVGASCSLIIDQESGFTNLVAKRFLVFRPMTWMYSKRLSGNMKMELLTTTPGQRIEVWVYTVGACLIFKGCLHRLHGFFPFFPLNKEPMPGTTDVFFPHSWGLCQLSTC